MCSKSLEICNRRIDSATNNLPRKTEQLQNPQHSAELSRYGRDMAPKMRRCNFVWDRPPGLAVVIGVIWSDQVWKF